MRACRKRGIKLKRLSARLQISCMLFIAMALPILSAVGVIYQKNVNTAMSTTIDNHIEILRQYRKNFDLVYEQIWSKAMEYGLDASFEEALNRPDGFGQVEKWKMINKMSQIKISNPFISSIYFIRNPDGPNAQYVDPDWRYMTDPGNPEWADIYRKSAASIEKVPVRNIPVPHGEQVASSIVLRMPYKAVFKTGMMLIQIDTASLVRHVIGELNKEHLLITDGKGARLLPIYNRGQQQAGPVVAADSLHSDEGMNEFKYHGADMIQLHVKVSSMDAYLVKLVKKNDLLASEMAARWAIVIAALLLLLTSAVLSYVLSAYIYRPVRLLLSGIKDMLGRASVQEQHNHSVLTEVEQISRGFSQLLQENKKLRITYNNMFPQMKDRFYYNLLVGKCGTKEEIERQATLLQIDLTCTHFGLLVLELDSETICGWTKKNRRASGRRDQRYLLHDKP